MRVVIVGGGFAAVQFAKTLGKKLRASECEIVVFNRENHMVFHPLLADVAGASINPDAAATPLRQMLPRVACRTEHVQRVDLRNSQIEFDDGSGVLSRMPYDLWCAKIPSGSHLTEMLALICRLPCARKPKKPALPGRKHFSAELTVCHPDRPCLDSFRTQSFHWFPCLT